MAGGRRDPAASRVLSLIEVDPGLSRTLSGRSTPAGLSAPRGGLTAWRPGGDEPLEDGALVRTGR